MHPRPLNNRSDLIAIIREHPPTKACGHAIDEDRVTVLGGFTPVEGLPYWLVRITSQHDRMWYIALTVDERTNSFGVEYPDKVKWKDWSGKTNRDHPVYDGDNPREYAFKRMKARNGN